MVLTNFHIVRDAIARGEAVTVTLSDGKTKLTGVVEHSVSPAFQRQFLDL